MDMHNTLAKMNVYENFQMKILFQIFFALSHSSNGDVFREIGKDQELSYKINDQKLNNTQ